MREAAANELRPSSLAVGGGASLPLAISFTADISENIVDPLILFGSGFLLIGLTARELLAGLRAARSHRNIVTAVTCGAIGYLSGASVILAIAFFIARARFLQGVDVSPGVMFGGLASLWSVGLLCGLVVAGIIYLFRAQLNEKGTDM